MTHPDTPVVAKAIADVAAWYTDLEEYLLPRRGGHSEHKHTKAAAEPLPFDHAVARLRTNIHWHLHCWVKIGLDEGPFDAAPPQTIAAQAAWLHQRNDWYCNSQDDPRACQEYIDQTLQLRRECEQQQQPNAARRIKLKTPSGGLTRCPEPGCTGTLIAVMRPADDLLPPEVRCDVGADNPEHRDAWAADEWLTLGRRVAKAVGA